MHFKIDENLPSDASRIFSEAGHNAVSVLDQRLGGRPDADIAACKAESRILITLDTDFANILAYPPGQLPGIIEIRIDDQARQNVLDFIHKTVAALESESPERRLWIVEPHRIRVRGPEQTREGSP